MLLLSIPFKGKLKLLIVLEEENIERIKRHDCAEILWSQLGDHAALPPDDITIGYANASELVLITKWAQEGKIAEALALITSGFQYLPERGDGAAPEFLKGGSNV